MPKIERTTQPVFGNQGNNNEFAIFGSMKTGKPVWSKNPAALLQSPSYSQGWQDAVAIDKAPFLEETNGLFYALTSQLAYLFQQGIPEWDAKTTYYANTSFCQVNGVWYQSLTDENLGNDPVEDINNWKKIDFRDIENLINDVKKLQEDVAKALTLENKEEIASWSMPDYTAGINITSYIGKTYTAPADGIVYLMGNWNDTTLNSIVWQVGDGGTGSRFSTTTFYLPKGTKISIVGETSGRRAYFYPLKGAR